MGLPHHEDLPNSYTSVAGHKVVKLSKYTGAAVLGLSEAELCDPNRAADLRRTLAIHGVLVFQGLDMEAQDLEEFSSQFGPLIRHPALRYSLEGHPNVTIISNIRDEIGEPIGADRSGMDWHSDRSFRPIPADITFLYGKECPPSGADTEFISAYVAYDQLSRDDRIALSSLRGIHDYSWYWLTYQSARPPLNPTEAGEPSKHPVLCRHPITGRGYAFVSEGVTRGIAGMTEGEGRAKVLELMQYEVLARDKYSHHWTEGDLVVWDNCATQHKATEYDNCFRRKMLRTQTEGRVPVAIGVHEA